VNQQTQIGTVAYKRKSLWRRPDKWLTGYLFVGPAAILLIVFSIIAIAVSFYLSFFDFDIISRGGPFVGLGNYREALFADKLFWTALFNTACYAVGVVPGITICAFLLAFAGNRVIMAKEFFALFTSCPPSPPWWSSHWSGSGSIARRECSINF